MLHELLFALLGKPGTIVRADGKGLMVDRSLNIFKEQEVTLLNQMVAVGYHYSCLNDFVQKEIYQLFDYSSLSQRESSLYRQALAAGIDCFLQEYTQVIQAMESAYLEHKHFTIGSMKAELVKYELVFPEVLSIVEEVRQGGLRGGLIVNLVYEKYREGNSWVR